MNKNLFKMALVAVLSAGMLLSGCSKDDDDDTKGSFTYDGTTVEFIGGSLDYFGSNMKNSSETSGLTLALWSSGINFDKEEGTGSMISFDMISTSSTELPSGTYTYIETSKVSEGFKFNSATGYINFNIATETGTVVEIYGGTVTVEKNGSTYKLIIDCEDVNGKKITGSYEGTLEYNDFSKLYEK